MRIVLTLLVAAGFLVTGVSCTTNGLPVANSGEPAVELPREVAAIPTPKKPRSSTDSMASRIVRKWSVVIDETRLYGGDVPPYRLIDNAADWDRLRGYSSCSERIPDIDFRTHLAVLHFGQWILPDYPRPDAQGMTPAIGIFRKRECVITTIKRRDLIHIEELSKFVLRGKPAPPFPE